MGAAPGRKSTEFMMSVRSEILGTSLLALGAFVAYTTQDFHRGCVGVGLSAVGAFLLAKVNAAYAVSRGTVKAAQARPHVQVAPRDL